MINSDNKKTILCYGDSNTYGAVPAKHHTRYSKKERWTGILEGLLGSDYELIEEGLNGRTTAYDRNGSSFQNGLTPLKAIFCSHKPIDFIVFMLGTNDCNMEMNLEAEDIRDGMEKLISLIRNESKNEQDYIPKILVIAPSPILSNIKGTPYEYQLDESSIKDSLALKDLYKKLAEKWGCLFFDANNIEVSPLDCEHLTLKGHHDLAYEIYKIIRENNHE